MVENDKIDVKIEDKRLVLWRDVLKGAEEELLKTEEIYFKNTEYHKNIIKFAKKKIKQYERQ